MITKSNLKNMLISIGFINTSNDKYEKQYSSLDCSITVDFKNEKITYPEDKGFKVNVATTTNFSEPENFVVLECVNRLLDKGYRPNNIELERTWTLGHEQKSGRADICVSDQNGKMLFIVECKAWVNNHAHIIKPKNEDELQYLYYYFYFLDLTEYVKDGLGRNKLTQGNLRNINIVIPQSDDLKLFADYTQSCDKLKFEVQELTENHLGMDG